MQVKGQTPDQRTAISSGAQCQLFCSQFLTDEIIDGQSPFSRRRLERGKICFQRLQRPPAGIGLGFLFDHHIFGPDCAFTYPAGEQRDLFVRQRGRFLRHGRRFPLLGGDQFQQIAFVRLSGSQIAVVQQILNARQRHASLGVIG